MSTALQKLQNKLQTKENKQFGGDATNAGVAMGHTMMKTEEEHITALQVQVPRVKSEVLERVIEEAELGAENMVYQWTVNGRDGKQTIKGPSIQLAMAMVREWGNCFVDVTLAGEDASHWVFKGTFCDLERGFKFPRMFRQRKDAGRMGKMDTDRAEDIVFQIGQSKAIRNAIVNAMPQWLVNAAMEAAEESLAKKLTDGGIVHSIEKAQRLFSKYDVKMHHLEKKIGKSSNEWTDKDIVTLRSTYTSIQEGQTSAAQEFDLSDDAKQATEDAFKSDSKKDEGKKKEVKKNEKKASKSTAKKETKKKKEEVKKEEPPQTAPDPVPEQLSAEDAFADEEQVPD